MKWKEASTSKDLKIDLGKNKVKINIGMKRMACLKVKLIHVGSAA